jgi:hypothetical protein
VDRGYPLSFAILQQHTRTSVSPGEGAEWAQTALELQFGPGRELNPRHIDARCFDYVYDFGDDWHHVALVEDQHIESNPTASIRCIDGENACPPEDVGGAFRYAEFLTAIADPSHEEHKAFREWSGGTFDPTRSTLPTEHSVKSKRELFSSLEP